ncbi:MAG: type II toxin-antitoxin system HipA family toxin [Hyphomonadaceae bacterium]
MGRRKIHPSLNVYMNNRLVGLLEKATSGAVSFQYSESWLTWDYAIPLSMSLPLQSKTYTGASVLAVIENLLPDVEAVRRRVAERVGAEGVDAYSLLAKIGRDCVGALQFIDGDQDLPPVGQVEGEPLDEDQVCRILKALKAQPLGLEDDDAFRISVAGAQEKTALLWHNGQWMKPLGTTPTTHILKPQIGQIPTMDGVIDLSNSVENEYYCLKLFSVFGLKIPHIDMHSFGDVRTLVVERFDRQWTKDGRLLRVPQEDFCQALSVPSTKKYQSHGGPTVVEILEALRGSDTPFEDQMAFFKSQILFWLIGATDGHAKNFSIQLRSGGKFQLTPFYDVLTAQPAVDDAQIRHNKYKLAMSVGKSKHYDIFGIHRRHFIETAKAASLSAVGVHELIEDITVNADRCLKQLRDELPNDFPDFIHQSVSKAMRSRLIKLQE